jgi:hypothetical protein
MGKSLHCGEERNASDGSKVCIASKPLTPGMVRWPGLRVRLQKMVQDVQQGQNVLLVAAELSSPDIVNNNVPDFFASVLLRQEVLSECCCGDFGEVVMLSDGEHLLFGQAAQPDAILKCDHVRLKAIRLIGRVGDCDESLSSAKTLSVADLTPAPKMATGQNSQSRPKQILQLLGLY